ncbi:MAG: hypothetical protein RBU23_07880 [Candidatus Auribacterota bacterium]|jgi:hypothetical protein|nr:hypothetical protein [Candidatus Auribacterota bacterium]
MNTKLLLAGVLCGSLISVSGLKAEGKAPLLIDNFDKQGNSFGGRSSTYVKEPSGIFAGNDSNIKRGDAGRSLKLRYKKANQGGPYGKGGWCGYYTIVKSGPRSYFDATGYTYLTLWVRGEEGGENFKIGVADEAQEQREDSVKTEEIGVYLPAGKITTEWQQARIPLDEVFVDLEKLASLAICFEGDCFPDGGGKGTVYIDDMYFE